MRQASEQKGVFAKSLLVVSVLFGLSACQSGGVAVSSYNGDQFADAIANSQKAVDLSAVERDRGGSNRTYVKPSKPVPNFFASVAKPNATDNAGPVTAGDAVAELPLPENADSELAAVQTALPSTEGPTIVASLRDGGSSALPGVSDPFATVEGETEMAVTRPTLRMRSMNGAAQPVNIETVGGTVAQRRALYASLIRKHAEANGVPLDLAMAVVQIESMYRPMAVGTSGEIGLMQILPRTARFIGYTGSMKALHDPDTNIRYGMKYLGKAHRLGGGSVCGTILKYNAGHGAKKMNSVSRKYCNRVSAILQET